MRHSVGVYRPTAYGKEYLIDGSMNFDFFLLDVINNLFFLP